MLLGFVEFQTLHVAFHKGEKADVGEGEVITSKALSINSAPVSPFSSIHIAEKADWTVIYFTDIFFKKPSFLNNAFVFLNLILFFRKIYTLLSSYFQLISDKKASSKRMNKYLYF